MVSLVENGSIQVPLWDPAQVTDPNMTNPTFVRQYLANLLQTAFPNLQPYVILCSLPLSPITFSRSTFRLGPKRPRMYSSQASRSR